jgi:hypothetical protein
MIESHGSASLLSAGFKTGQREKLFLLGCSTFCYEQNDAPVGLRSGVAICAITLTQKDAMQERRARALRFFDAFRGLEIGL